MLEPLQPPRPLTPEGAPRRVGIEIEFAGLDSEEAAQFAADAIGGAVQEMDAHRHKLAGSSLGDLIFELDMSRAHSDGSKDANSLTHKMKASLQAAIGTIGSLWMPYEVVFPPLPVERLGEVDRLVAELRARGAKGTDDLPIYAFGLHFNPEAAAFDADYLKDQIKAFALLAPGLRRIRGMNPMRRLSPYVAPYPHAYVRKLADPTYAPDLDRLVEDYLASNGTRDRELDMLPLFAQLDHKRIRARVRDAKVKPRPTFHYRLPDSRIDAAGWGVVEDWNWWVRLERLAADPERLQQLGEAYLKLAAGADTAAWASEAARQLEA